MSDLAAISHEISTAIHDVNLAECSYALELEAMAANAQRRRLERVALHIRLSETATQKVLDDWRRRAELMHAANDIIRRLISQPPPIVA